MKYAYRGPVPVPDENRELVHPGDVREFDVPPDCPPWELLPGQQQAAPPAATPSLTVTLPAPAEM